MNPIRIQRLGRSFQKAAALHDLSMEIYPQELFAILGPDGSGKTTLCRILAGILDPSDGEARVAGHDVVQGREKIKEVIGYMPQNFGLYQDLTVDENIHFYADLYGISREERRPRMERLLAITNLSPFTRRLARDLSGGMKQKLTLSCCLIHTPKILILDEPTLGVDPASRREFWKLLYDLLKEGVTILVSTSYMDEAQRCSRVALLYRGEIAALGSPEELRSLVPGTMIQLVPSDMKGALSLLRSLEGVRLVTPFGEKVHALTEEGVEGPRIIGEELQKAGIEVKDLQRVPPSLEDVFIYIVQERGKA